jgi:dCMP deaminase
MLINADIKKVVFGTTYPDTEALKFFDKAGVIVEQMALKTEPKT